MNFTLEQFVEPLNNLGRFYTFQGEFVIYTSYNGEDCEYEYDKLGESFLSNIGVINPDYQQVGEIQLTDFKDESHTFDDAVIGRLKYTAKTTLFDNVDKIILQEATNDGTRGQSICWTRGVKKSSPKSSVSAYDILRLSRILGIDDYRFVGGYSLMYYDPVDRVLKLQVDIDNLST
jgi:hypothetical protein